MAVDLDALFQQEAFSNLEPEKVATFRKFAGQLDGKSGTELVGLFVQFNKELSRGRPLTKEERSAVIETIGGAMAPADQPKFRNVVKMINMMDRS